MPCQIVNFSARFMISLATRDDERSNDRRLSCHLAAFWVCTATLLKFSRLRMSATSIKPWNARLRSAKGLERERGRWAL